MNVVGNMRYPSLPFYAISEVLLKGDPNVLQENDQLLVLMVSRYLPKFMISKFCKQTNLCSCAHFCSQIGRFTALPSHIEDDLEKHLLFLDKYYFGLMIMDVRRLAYDIGDQNPHLGNVFNKDNKLAGKKWYYNFMTRHSNLRLRQPESISINRAKGFNRENVYEFFDLLEAVVDEHGIDATRMYNVDKNGFSTVQKKNSKVISQKGKNRVGAISSGERGVNTTYICVLL